MPKLLENYDINTILIFSLEKTNTHTLPISYRTFITQYRYQAHLIIFGTLHTSLVYHNCDPNTTLVASHHKIQRESSNIAYKGPNFPRNHQVAPTINKEFNKAQLVQLIQHIWWATPGDFSSSFRVFCYSILS